MKKGHGGGVARREFLRRAGVATAGLAAAPLRSWAVPSTRTKPNVLFIITDQQHADTIQAGGCSHIRTPALDSLTRSGCRFAQCYSTNPLCSPARSSMFTGRPTSETGVYRNGRGIRAGMPTLGRWLAEHGGYESVYAGKWHLPHTHDRHIDGFKVISSGIGGQGNLGDASTSRACQAFLRNRHRSRPFFLVASFMQPHDICEWLRLNSDRKDRLRYPSLRDDLPPLPANFQYDAREPAAVKSRRAGNEGMRNGWEDWEWSYYIWSYYRHVEMVDAEIGRVLQALHDTGCTQDTLVIFTADHGEGIACHQTTRKNSLYDEACRVPFIASWPGQVPEDTLDGHSIVSGLDITPTICDYAEVGIPEAVRGRSLRDALEGAPMQGAHDMTVSEVLNNSGRMVRTTDYKYVTYRDDPVEQLFDMRRDPGETRNLAADAAFAAEVRSHRKLLYDWERRLDVQPEVPEPDTWRKG